MDADSYRRVEPAPFRLTESSSGSVVRLSVRGEVDTSTADDLVEAMTSIIQADAATRLVVDLAGVSFLAAAGIAALVTAYHRGQERKIEVVVVNCRPTMARVLEITGVDKILASGEAQPR
jgi:anti-anti-sigma factor